VKGIGVDVVSLSEMQGTLERVGDAFLERVFAAEEMSEIPDAGGVRLRHIASRWAVKEAVFKCLGAAWTPDASFADIVVTRSAAGPPEVAVRGDFAVVLAARGGGALLVSLSVSADTAVAVAALG
jgi:holo-[acyl-carrier protein] synthase